jgi:hypothetical protein
MPAGPRDYDGVEYADMVFLEIDWSEIAEHDPARRSDRKGTTEHDVATEWATEACQDPHRLVRSAGSRSGRTVKVTGWSPGAAFVITVIVAPKDSPPADRWWGATAWKANRTEVQTYEER